MAYLVVSPPPPGLPPMPMQNMHKRWSVLAIFYTRTRVWYTVEAWQYHGRLGNPKWSRIGRPEKNDTACPENMVSKILNLEPKYYTAKLTGEQFVKLEMR